MPRCAGLLSCASRLATLACLGLLLACGGGRATASATGGGSATTSTSGAGGAASCASDPLHTGLVAQQTGVSVDAFDCAILAWSAKYSEPDPMIFKAIIDVESRFDQTSVACPNLPCGTPSGWTAAESGCFGLMQVVPAAGRRRTTRVCSRTGSRTSPPT